ncbi:hypothetical protein N7495_000338 [Penicillium taxi]|uniref:uncharacterized protein n=1 Tax=Penicillium taxi TaxID=168475 RepID=UPI0025459F7C|nr:uncharacterized protein N7495_000338 [Penicillium taxi]KAJ5907656.1 hypothetical protein N7495_000338 [Penicillium taxi]
MSIGIIEQLLDTKYDRTHERPSLVTFFFCQNGDSELNTIEALLKGLILQLLKQNLELKECLRRRWDSKKNRFLDDMTSWHALWNIFREMLSECRRYQVYVIIDALDECVSDGVSDFLKMITYTGLQSSVKWLVISRPFRDAERQLMAGINHKQATLDLESENIESGIQKAIGVYIASKVVELQHLNGFSDEIKHTIKRQLNAKADGTYLWISLVCKKLEGVHPDNTLNAIDTLPPDLHSFYHRVCLQLTSESRGLSQKYMRILKVMLLAYRPLDLNELESVTGFKQGEFSFDEFVIACQSILKIRGNSIEFVHQSVRDYLHGREGESLLDTYESWGHSEIVLQCVDYMSRRLKADILDFARPDVTRKGLEYISKERAAVLSDLDYAVHHWTLHLKFHLLTDLIVVHEAIEQKAAISNFVKTYFLEWIECLSWLDSMPDVIMGTQRLRTVAEVQDESFLLEFTHDATRFLQRHSYTLGIWPLQIYSSALIFSPDNSIIRKLNRHKLPFEGHTEAVSAVGFSPDGKHIASTSTDGDIYFWRVKTGDLEEIIEDDDPRTKQPLIFSPDGKWILSICHGAHRLDYIKVWNIAAGELHATFKTEDADTATFTANSKYIVSVNYGRSPAVEFWDIQGSRISSQLKMPKNEGREHGGVALSPDGRYMASCTKDNKFGIWTPEGALIRFINVGKHEVIDALAFSHDGIYVASSSGAGDINIWNTKDGTLLQSLQKPPSECELQVQSLNVSPTKEHIVAVCYLGPVLLWNVSTGAFLKILTLSPVNSLEFSPDGTHIASASSDHTISLWDIAEEDDLSPNASKIVALSTDGGTTTVATYKKPHLTVKNSDDETLIWNMDCPDLLDYSVKFSVDGKFIAWASTSDSRSYIHIAGTTDSYNIRWKAHRGCIGALAFSPDGKLLASSGAGKHLIEVNMWTTEGKHLRTLAAHNTLPLLLSFSPDCKFFASSDEHHTHLWDLRKCIDYKYHFSVYRSWDRPSKGNVYNLKFSTDGKSIYTDNGVLRLKKIFPETSRVRSATLDDLDLWVSDQWIHLGPMPFIRLPADHNWGQNDAKKNHVVISFPDRPHPIEFNFDRVLMLGEILSKGLDALSL